MSSDDTWRDTHTRTRRERERERDCMCRLTTNAQKSPASHVALMIFMSAENRVREKSDKSGGAERERISLSARQGPVPGVAHTVPAHLTDGFNFRARFRVQCTFSIPTNAFGALDSRQSAPPPPGDHGSQSIFMYDYMFVYPDICW